MNVSSFDLYQKNKQLKKEYQNLINDRVMPITKSHAKVTVGLFWAESWLFRSHFLKISRLQYLFFQSVRHSKSCNFGYK